jgi:Protein of unknown function (DUF3052)
VALSGYSGTPLPQKLGVKPGARLALLGAPDQAGALLEPLPDGVAVTRRATAGQDVIVFFTTARADLVRRLPSLRRAMKPAGALWVAWPKRASKVATDMTEDVVREVALPTGLVDVKVCAIDETWSGLKLVVRLSERGLPPRR